MKTSKEFFERLQSDEAFAAEVSKKTKDIIDAGQNDYKEIWIPIAAEYDYEVTAEELGKVSGGITPLLAVTSVIIIGGASAVSIGVSLVKTVSADKKNPNAPNHPGV